MAECTGITDLMKEDIENLRHDAREVRDHLSSALSALPKGTRNGRDVSERIERLKFFGHLAGNIQSNIPALSDGSIVEPRAFQYRALRGLLAFLGNADSNDRTARYIGPPGAGKTVLYGLFLRLMEVRTLILAPLSNLPLQAKQDLIAKVGILEKNIGVVADDVCEVGRPVTIATYQGHVQKMKTDSAYRDVVRQCELVICDEGHTSLGEATGKSIDALSRDEELVLSNPHEQTNGSALKIAFTATPDLIAKSVSDRFRGLIAHEHLSTLVREGALPKYKILPLAASLEPGEIESSISDAQEARLLERENIYARALRRLEKLRREVSEEIYALAFCSNIRECDRLQEIAAAQKMRCRIVTSREYERQSGIDHMQETKEQLLAKEIDLAASVDKLQTGWDFPELNTVLALRATLSPAIPPQEAGRAGRAHPGKHFSYIIEPQWKMKIPDPVRSRTATGSVRFGGKMRSKILPTPKYYRKPLTLAESLHLLGEPDIEEVCEGLCGEKIPYDSVTQLDNDGTAMIKGVLCAGISALVSARGYDFETLDKAVLDLVARGKLQPKGYALNRNRYVPVFELKRIEAIPYVRERMALPKITLEDPDILIGDEPHTGLSLLTRIHGLDYETLKKYAETAGIKPSGRALSETHTINTYPRKPLEALPYVKLRTTLPRVDTQSKKVTLNGIVCMGLSAFRTERNLTNSAMQAAIKEATLKPVGRAMSPQFSIDVYELRKLESLKYVQDRETLPSIDSETGLVPLGAGRVGIGISALCTTHPSLKYATLKRLIEEGYEGQTEALEPIGYALNNGHKTPVYDAAEVLRVPAVQHEIDTRTIDELRKRIARLKRGKATRALPGSKAKLDKLAQRYAEGMPLWNKRDRSAYSEETEDA